jgi:dTDP-glucose pyrophosphorylase
MNIIVLMAGASTDFETRGYVYPKYLLEIQGLPIIQRVVDSLKVLDAIISFVIRKEDDDKSFLASTLRILSPESPIYKVGNMTRGATCSALFAIDQIDNEDELVIINGDQLITANLLEAVNDFRSKACDGGVICFNSIHPRWSFVSLDEHGFVNETSEKRPISNLATAGFYYFRHGSDFVRSAFENIRKDVNYDNKYYVCSTYNELILEQKKVGVFQIGKEQYISFSTPHMYDNYLNNKEK